MANTRRTGATPMASNAQGTFAYTVERRGGGESKLDTVRTEHMGDARQIPEISILGEEEGGD